MKPADVTERQVRDALKASVSITDAAKSLAVSRRAIYRLMKQYGVEVRRIVS